ncbi:MAG: hypothetical protein KGO01_05825 [Burkholderiales bacterium]|nr:hypothetical protein [Burkholderiales bacterium]
MAGFKEQTGPVGYRQTQSRFAVEGARLRSLANGKSYGIGRLELLSLRELRQRAGSGLPVRGECRIRAIHGEAGQLHADAAHHRALFQVASQFNLLEMAGPGVVPEEGVTGYVNDPTQGPACAIAAGAATIYRNYFVPVNGEIGQRADRQIDGLASLGAELGRRMNEPAREIWTMRNGYAMFEPRAVGRVSNYLAGLDEGERDAIRQMLQIGVQWDVEVTAGGAPQGQQVTQAFCSALPIGYHHDGQSALEQWEPVARLVLDALYEATLWAAVINAQNGGSRTVLLTFVGGGVFRNKVEWIRSAIERAVRATAGHGLDIVVVYFHAPTALDRSWVGTLGSAA